MPVFNPTGQINPENNIEVNDISGPIELDVDDNRGLSTEELRDPNKIKVNIGDPDAPIVILYGPPSCGKTMTLVRLTRFLQSSGYSVKPERGFRPTGDTHYRSMCENFDEMMNSDDAATSTNHISFMLVKVYNRQGKCLCQILEAPGEYYFTKDSPNAPYPYYFQTIKSTSNRKVWAVIVEPDWEDPQDRKNYVTRIQKLKSQIHVSDKVVFVYNKIDLTDFVRNPGNVNISEAVRRVSQDYPGIFSLFENTNPITKLWRKYDCGFVPFQTGYYTEASDGKLSFSEGPVEYVSNLWNEILKQI